MTYRGVHFLADTSSGRKVSSGRDDGMHITCNSGTVTITECTFHALMDDPINVHGCCVTSDEVIDDRILRCKYRHHQACGFLYWAEKGDEINFISRDSMESIGSANVESYTLEDHMTFLLKFDRPLPKDILEKAKKGNALALDNLTILPPLSVQIIDSVAVEHEEFWFPHRSPYVFAIIILSHPVLLFL